ncbi:protein FAR1-RELATED SEQUENCE 4-like [Triticum aestivum]|uniref:protein FAR1-RELATED SEQUENCE 4-like n=1 Tax=Triticum aestivum TaxID=4565 RepID=UPI001D006D06|nr:protein FAR1-RELATED SEQUENCE 4-like [Triticum aestivum]
MFEKFGEILYEAGQYKVEEVEKGAKYYVHRYHPEKHDKWCRALYVVEVVDQGKELTCECGNFEHTGLLCCHAVKVLDFLGIGHIPAKHILKRWTKDARDVLPQHLAYLQKDQISVNPITFRHSNLYTHALEVVRLGEANTSAYECAMELLKEAIHKLTPMAAVRDGMGLDDVIQANKEKAREVSVGQAPQIVYGSDPDGSAVGNLLSLMAPEHTQKAGWPTSSRDKPPYYVRAAKSKKRKIVTHPAAAGACDTSKPTRFCRICRQPGHKSTTCPQRGDLPRKTKKEAKCSICGVGGHRMNTCNNPMVVLHAVENMIYGASWHKTDAP